MIELAMTPCRAGLPFGCDAVEHVLVRVAQRRPIVPGASKRLPLNLALVIDKSGSMAGRPLEEAKRCAAMVLDTLAETDRLAIVAYDDRAEVYFPSALVKDKAPIRTAIETIRSGGSTNLHGGWLAGATEVAQFAVDGAITRILVLSDGRANRGVVDPVMIARHCGEMAAQKVTTSTYGLGEAFNEDLMTEMARAGQGQSHYGRTADDLSDPFMQELDMLRAIVARDIRLRLRPVNGVRVTVLNQYPFETTAGAYRLPDLAEGGEVWALLRLEVDGTVMPELGSALRLMSADLSYMDHDGRDEASGSVDLTLGTFAPSVHDAMEKDQQVLARLRQVTVAGLAEEARQAALARDWQQVDALTARMLDEAGSDDWVIKSVRVLRELASARDLPSFSKEAHYKSNRFRNRMSRPEGESMTWSEAEEATAPSYLRKKIEEGRRFDGRPNDEKNNS